jgi:hypothetical protein
VPCLFRQLAFDESGVRSRGHYDRATIPRGKSWKKWSSDELPRLIAIRKYCEDVVRDGPGALLHREWAVMDTLDVSGGPAGQHMTEEARAALDDVAPEWTAEMIYRFARATIARLP